MTNEEGKILIIDDEPAVLRSFNQAFIQEGYQVFQTKTWFEASEYLKLHRFNVVIADIRLPDISYREMIKLIKKENHNTYIITTAGYTDIEIAIESLKHGANDYISKPFNPSEVIVSLRKIFERINLQEDNLHLYETIKSLAIALDARDHYTHGHSVEVTDYSVSIAQAIGLEPKMVEIIREAGILHDIGKIGISDQVLHKPGRLTPEEYEHIKQHPVIGKKILEPVSSLADKIPLIYHHHEHFDGSGYPERLVGEDIPLGARIIAIADAYQAMTSDRPYRPALPRQTAINELQKNKQTQFDARLVDVFLELLRTKYFK